MKVIKERHIFFAVVLGTVLVLVLGILLLPKDMGTAGRDLPWQIELDADGQPRVFGITLGSTTLAELERHIGEPVVISLFAHDSGERVIEGFFDNVTLGGLHAKMVVVMDFSEAELQAIYARGARIATSSSGARKVTLASEDIGRVHQAPVVAITYLPRTRLTPELLAQRFGEPAERLREADGGTEHWLYPQQGLGIALQEKGNAVLQYVLPAQFDSLRAPLLSEGAQ